MAKEKTVYVCTNCGYESPKWAGKCPSCGQWNTFTEEVVRKETPVAKHVAHGIEAVRTKPQRLHEITSSEELRIDMKDDELNRVLGGGLVRLPDLKVLYVSGEESARQLKLRADRIPHPEETQLLIACETSLEQIFTHIKNTAPDLVIIDSIQTISTETIDSSPGSIVQVRECSAAILKFAKETGTPVILIGHAELGIYEMRQDGLRQVSNPSELLLTQDHEGMSGVAIACAVEGIRPFLIEVQALVSTAAYGMPQRSATGFDLRRMNMLLAVLEKRVGFKLAQKDVFLNIAGGLKVNDPAIDLAVISAILSSNMDTEIETGVCMAGEVGLSGEIRPVNRIEQRIGEAEKLGFKRMLIPKHNLQGLNRSKIHIELVPVRKVEEAFRELFG